MTLELVGALLIAAFVLWLVLTPILGAGRTEVFPPEPLAEEETRRGIALIALKEIEFDRATGKLSDTDYESLKDRYSQEALAAIEAEPAADPEQLIAARLRHLKAADVTGNPAPPPCRTCGIRPEPDALFCSSCGVALVAPEFCVSCGKKLDADSRFCADCGTKVAA
ncbi:MAG TPA: zinc ribbon domain-containing protein [Gemmatimonadales bacterium]|nr:zinc ribbon domain-containing protein [Gemmatimonadales bacterium]